MKKGIWTAVLFFFIFSLGALARAEERLIKLKDGSVIQGDVLSKEGDTYKIKTAALGVVSVSEANIVSITAPQQAAEPSLSGQEKDYQQKILSNPQAMEDVKTLAQDKDVLALLSDPQLKEAIERRDLGVLQSNEKFIKFMNKPAVKNIIENTVIPQQNNTTQ